MIHNFHLTISLFYARAFSQGSTESFSHCVHNFQIWIPEDFIGGKILRWH